ncbi:hypothetical protein [Thiolapillus sp.]|uniref:hypothetical protein n=1 Tax=Thiolapillus sp. TaxID=2017437 RepID=UPI003AF92851
MKNETEKYYIVEIRWTGPDQTGAKYVDYDRYEITTAPTRNTSGDIQLSGWLGPDGSVARYAHGEYGSLAAADYAVVKMLDGDFRRYDGCRFHGYGAVVAIYRPGKYPPMCDGFLDEAVLMAAKNNVVSVPREFTSWDQEKAIVRDLRDAFNRDGYDAPANRIGHALMRVIDDIRA